MESLFIAYWQGWFDAWSYFQAVQASNALENREGAGSTTYSAHAKDQWLVFYQRFADYEAALDGAAPTGVRLNLGSGDIVLRGFVNVDTFAHPGVFTADLREPWPWEDDSIDYVRASHIIEHLPDKIFTMNELWRVLKPGGRVRISVPTTEGSGAWQDPTHVSYWNRRSFLYFEDGAPYRTAYAKSYGIRAKFRILRERLDQTPDGPILEITLVAEKP